MEDKDRDDVMERLLELGGDKKYLTFDDLNRELPYNVVSPDDIEDVLQKLEGSNIPVADSDERLLEQVATTVADEDEDGLDEDIELDLSAGALEKTNDPVRLYLREMGVVPLLTREGETDRAWPIKDAESDRAFADCSARGFEDRRGSRERPHQHSRHRYFFRTG